jgi:hypothetical protein
MSPPVNMQIEDEFVANPPWDAPLVLSFTLGGAGGNGAHAAIFGLEKAWNEVKHTVSGVISEAVQKVKERAHELKDIVESQIFESAYKCINGANELVQAIEGDDWAQYSKFVLVVALAGCKGGTEDMDFGVK